VRRSWAASLARIVVGGPVAIRRVEPGLVRSVIVERAWLVGVDVPHRGPGDLARQAGISQRMVKRPGFPFEDVGVGAGPDERLDEVGVAGVFERRDRIFQRVGVQVAQDQEIGVGALGGICRQPAREGLGGSGAGSVAVALAVAGVRIERIVQRGAGAGAPL